MINWKQYYNSIPSQIKVGNSIYRIFWVDSYAKDPKQLGETNFDGEKFITININQSVREAVKTYFHELCHAVSNEWGINLTERQVMLLEKSIPSLLKPNNILTKGMNSAARKKRKSKNL